MTNVTDIKAYRTDKRQTDHSLLFHVFDSPHSREIKGEFRVPNLVIVAYSWNPKETPESTEVEVASLGYRDTDGKLGLPPILLDSLINLSATDSKLPRFTYQIRRVFMPALNVGLVEMGRPAVSEGRCVRVMATSIYSMHYNRDEILASKPSFVSK